MRSGCGESGPPSMARGWMRSSAPCRRTCSSFRATGPSSAMPWPWPARGRIAVIAPEDERDLAEAGWADDIRTFRPASLDAIRRIDEVVSEPLGTLVRELGLRCGRIGYEGGPESEPASYVGMLLYGPILESS